MIPGNIWFILKILSYLLLAALIFGFLGWWLRGFFLTGIKAHAPSAHPVPQPDQKEKERIKKLESQLKKAESSLQSLRQEHEAAQKDTVPRNSLTQAQTMHANLLEAHTASQKQLADLEEELKRSRSTAATLNAKVNDAGKSQHAATLALQNELAKTKEELARTSAESANISALKTEIEGLRESLAIANRANSQLRKATASPASLTETPAVIEIKDPAAIEAAERAAKEASEKAIAERAAKQAAEIAARHAAAKAEAERAAKEAAEKAAARADAEKAAAEYAASKEAAAKAEAERAAKEAAEKAAAELAAREAAAKADAERAAKEAAEKAAAELAAKEAAAKAEAERAAKEAAKQATTPDGELPLFAAAASPISSVEAIAAGSKHPAASEALGKRVTQDDLQVVEGIGPKIKELLEQGGITTWAQLADAPLARLEEILSQAGEAFAVHNPSTWPRQAALARDGKWAELKAWQDELDGGKE